MKQIFTVKGMTCGHCEKTVSKAVQALDAQARIVIDRTEQRVEIDTVVERQALVQAIEDEGYSVLA